MSDAWVFDEAVADFARGELDWERDDLRVMFITGNWTPSQAEDKTAADVRSYEVLPSGDYHTGGVPLADRFVGRGGVPNENRLSAGKVVCDGFTGSFRYAVIYNAETGRLVSCADVGRQQTTNGRVEIDYTDAGISFFTAAAV